MDVTTTAETMGGDEFAPVLGEQAQHAFQQAAHDNGANGSGVAVVDGDAAQHGYEGEAYAHYNGHARSGAPKGEQLDERADAGNDHGVLDEHCRGYVVEASGSGDDGNGGKIRNEHGKDMLNAVGECSCDGDLCVEIFKLSLKLGAFRRCGGGLLAHRKVISPVSGSIASTIAKDSSW